MQHELNILRAKIAEMEDTTRSLQTGTAGVPAIPSQKVMQDAQPPQVFRAVSDAAWNDTRQVWEVDVKALLDDGSLNTHIEIIACMGEETDDAPILSGDCCIETLSGDLRRVVVPVGGGRLPRLFDIRVHDGKIQCYLPFISPGGANEHVLYNRRPISYVPGEPVIYAGWMDCLNSGGTSLGLPGDGVTFDVFVQARFLDVANADHTNAEYVQWAFATSGVETGSYECIAYGLIARVTNTDDAYSVEQRHNGQLHLHRDDGDARVNQLLGGNALRRQRTIERMSGHAGAFQLADVDSLPEVVDWENARFGLVEDVSGVRRNKWETYAAVREALDIPDEYTPPYPIQDPNQPWPTPHGGIQDPTYPWPVPPAHPTLWGLEWEDCGHISGSGGPWYAGFDDDGNAVLISGGGMISAQSHAELGDLVDGIGTDDHCDLDRGGVGSNVAYLNLDGDAERNAMPGVIGGSEGEESYNPTARTITNAAGDTVTLDASVQQEPVEIAVQVDGSLCTAYLTTQPTYISFEIPDIEDGNFLLYLNENNANLHAAVEAHRQSIADLKEEITALRDALQEYKIIAESPP